MKSLRLMLLHRPVLMMLVLGLPVFLINYFAGRPGISGWDANFYYAYAGAIAETGRVDLDWAYAEMVKRGADPTVFDFRQRSRTGQAYNYFPIGHPLPHVPATLLGKWVSGAFERSGFSAFGPTAQLFYCLSCLAAAGLGLGLMRRVVAGLLGSEAAGAGLWAVAATSMLGYYWFVLPALSHTTSLLVLGVLLTAFMRAAADARGGMDECGGAAALGGNAARGAAGVGWFAVLGLAMGYLVAVRLQDAAFGAFGLVALVLLFRGALPPGAKAGRAAAMIAGGVLGLLPQLLLWKWKDGAWIYLGYNELPPVTNTFAWTRPQLLAVLFSPRHGLFLWHPALLAAFFGFIWWIIKGSAGVPPASYGSKGSPPANENSLEIPPASGCNTESNAVNGGQASRLSREDNPDSSLVTGETPIPHSKPHQPHTQYFSASHSSIAPPLALALLLAFAGVWYIGASYSVWWFGDSFGSRPFLSALPLFWIGAAWLWTRARVTALGRRLFWTAVCALGAWNAILALLFHLGRISRSEPLTISMIVKSLGL